MPAELPCSLAMWVRLVMPTRMCSLLQGHMSAVPALCLAPDGWHLLSGGRDKVVCVWDIRNGSKVATLPVYEALEGMSVWAEPAVTNWHIYVM